MGVTLIGPARTLAFASLLALTAGGCAITGTSKDLVTPPATLVPATKTGLVLDTLPPPRQKLDVAVYNFPDLTGQNKSNDNFAEFSRAVTQGGSSILTDVLVKAGGGAWFDVAERADLQSLLQERQIIQNTRTALMGKNAQSLPPLRFAGVLLDGGVIGYDTNETTGGIGANYLGIGGNVSYRQDIVIRGAAGRQRADRARAGVRHDHQDHLFRERRRQRLPVRRGRCAAAGGHRRYQELARDARRSRRHPARRLLADLRRREEQSLGVQGPGRRRRVHARARTPPQGRCAPPVSWPQSPSSTGRWWSPRTDRQRWRF